jgi:hypothetical protein
MRLCVFFILTAFCTAAIIDQLAVTVGNQAITENEITSDIRLAALLNGVAPDTSVTARRAAAARLIEQALIRREMSFGSYPSVPELEIDEAMAAAEKARGGRGALDVILKRYDLTRNELRNYLGWQLQFLQFIDLRFRPAVQVTNEDIEKYYQGSVVAAQPDGKAPELGAVRSQIEQKLSGERVDEQLDRWIRQSRARTTIRFEDQALAAQTNEAKK